VGHDLPCSHPPPLAHTLFLALQQAILVFDVGDRSSFDSLNEWLTEAKDFGAKKLQVVVCGNKVGTPRPQWGCEPPPTPKPVPIPLYHTAKRVALYHLKPQTDKKREVLESEALSWASEHRLEYVATLVVAAGPRTRNLHWLHDV
jgi:hypothetical protein